MAIILHKIKCSTLKIGPPLCVLWPDQFGVFPAIFFLISGLRLWQPLNISVISDTLEVSKFPMLMFVKESQYINIFSMLVTLEVLKLPRSIFVKPQKENMDSIVVTLEVLKLPRSIFVKDPQE